MTIVKINKKEKIIELSGHTSNPIVCHAISGLVDSVGSWLIESVDAEVISSDNAYFKMMPGRKTLGSIEFYENFFEFLIYSIDLIEKNNPGNIEIQEI